MPLVKNLARTPLALIAIICTGCVDAGYPTSTDLAANTSNVPNIKNAESARAYIYAARKQLLGWRSNLQSAEGVLDVGTGGGAIFTSVGGVLHWAQSMIVATTALSGTSYATNQTVRPRAQLDIVDSGLAALDCISAKAEAAYPVASTRQWVLAPVEQAKQTIDDDVAAHADPALKKLADAAAIKANIFLDANRPQVYQDVRLAVDAGVTTTFTQMRKATADPTSVLQAFQAINFASQPATATNTNTHSQLPEKPGGAKMAVLLDANGNPVLTPASILTSEITALDSAIDAASQQLAATSGGSAVDFTSCAPAQVLLTVTPAGPIDLVVGTRIGISVTGGQHSWNWSGSIPDQITVTTNSSSDYVVSSTASTPANQSYTLIFTPYANGSQKTVVINTKAATPKPQ
jgi:hypothetical protein